MMGSNGGEDKAREGKPTALLERVATLERLRPEALVPASQSQSPSACLIPQV